MKLIKLLVLELALLLFVVVAVYRGAWLHKEEFIDALFVLYAFLAVVQVAFSVLVRSASTLRCRNPRQVMVQFAQFAQVEPPAPSVNQQTMEWYSVIRDAGVVIACLHNHWWWTAIVCAAKIIAHLNTIYHWDKAVENVKNIGGYSRLRQF